MSFLWGDTQGCGGRALSEGQGEVQDPSSSVQPQVARSLSRVCCSVIARPVPAAQVMGPSQGESDTPGGSPEPVVGVQCLPYFDIQISPVEVQSNPSNFSSSLSPFPAFPPDNFGNVSQHSEAADTEQTCRGVPLQEAGQSQASAYTEFIGSWHPAPHPCISAEELQALQATPQPLQRPVALGDL